MKKLTSEMSGGGGGAEANGSDSSQFFTTTVNPALLPFYLIGRSQIPTECRPTEGKSIATPWDDWMVTGGKDGGFAPEFDDPDKLAIVMQARMNEIVQGASQKSSAYFRQRLVIDMPNLVNQTLTGQYMTVKKSLENTYNYLVRFEAKLSKDSMDVVLIPSVRETKTKIVRVLKSYDKLRALGDQMVKENKPSSALLNQVNTAAQEVIDSVFNEFNMLLQKDTFLTNRLTTFIEKDFSMRIKSGLNMNNYQQDLLTITQKHLLEKLTAVHGLSPTSSSIDLAHAQVVNRRNIHTLEEVFSDSMYRMILEMKSVAEGKGHEGAEEFLHNKYEAEKKAKRDLWWHLPSAVGGGIGGYLWSWLTAGSIIKGNHPEIYNGTINPNQVSGVDDKFHSFAQIQALFCSETLAFENRSVFRDVCQGTSLKSYYSSPSTASALDLSYDTYLPKNVSNFAIRKDANLTSRNICAYHNFLNRNLVQALRDQDSEMYGTDDIQ